MRGPAVRRVVVRTDAGDRVPVDRVPAVVVRVVPQTELELQPAALALGGDEAQHLQVALLLVRADPFGPYVVAVHVEQERVGEAQVVVGGAVPIGAVVVLHAEREVEPVEPGRGQPGQVFGPELLVVEPGQVLVHAGERPHHAPDGNGRLLGEGQRAREVVAGGDPVGELEQPAAEAGLVVADDNDLVVVPEDGVRLGYGGKVRGGNLVGGGQPDLRGDALRCQGFRQLLGRPAAIRPVVTGFCSFRVTNSDIGLQSLAVEGLAGVGDELRTPCLIEIFLNAMSWLVFSNRSATAVEAAGLACGGADEFFSARSV